MIFVLRIAQIVHALEKVTGCLVQDLLRSLQCRFVWTLYGLVCTSIRLYSLWQMQIKFYWRIQFAVVLERKSPHIRLSWCPCGGSFIVIEMELGDFFLRGRKAEEPIEKPSEQGKTNNRLNSHKPESKSNTGHVSRWAPSPLHPLLEKAKEILRLLLILVASFKIKAMRSWLKTLAFFCGVFVVLLFRFISCLVKAM